MCGDCVAESASSRQSFPGSRWTRRQALQIAAAGVIGAAGWPRVVGAGVVAPVAVAPGLDVWPRETWAVGRPPLAEPQPEDVRFLLVHHTAGSNAYDENGALEAIRGAYDFHTGAEKGWPDVAYNFFVDRFGRVFEARAGSLSGAIAADATGGSQGFAQLVCLVGDFTNDMPSQAAIDSLTRVLGWLADRHGIDTDPGAVTSFVSRGSNRWPVGAEVVAATISGHRDMSQTACPGDVFYPYVRDQLSASVSALRVPVVTTPAVSIVETTTPIATTSPVGSEGVVTTVAADPGDPAESGPALASGTVVSIVRAEDDRPVVATTTLATANLTAAASPSQPVSIEGDNPGAGSRVLAAVGTVGVLAAGFGVFHRLKSTRSVREPDHTPS